MTNIEKVKRILDAGHWVKVSYPDGDILTITSYHGNEISYLGKGLNCIFTFSKPTFENCTIEVIQRITTPYKAGEKVLVLSNQSPENKKIDAMVWKICEVYWIYSNVIDVWDTEFDSRFSFPAHCLAPAFDDEKDTDLKLSWKEVTVTIDGKEYTAVIK